MPDIEEVKEEFNRLDGNDKRWIFVSLFVAVAALVSAALGGSLVGDLIAFILTFSAGWFVHDQWRAIRGGSQRRNTASGNGWNRPQRSATRRKARSNTKAR